MLVDREIRARAGLIAPFCEGQLQPTSYDVLLDERYLLIDSRVEVLDARDPGVYTVEERAGEAGFLVHPGEFVIGSTVEVFDFPGDIVGVLSGKSSLARLGVQVESAGLFDPGFVGQGTLELSNMTQRPIRLYPGMRVAQMCFFEVSMVDTLYGAGGLASRYLGQRGPTASRGVS